MTPAIHRLRDATIRPLSRLTRQRSSASGATVLVMQPDHLGDIILAQPAVAIIREQFPNFRIVGVVGPWSAEVARMAWPVDDIVTIEYPGFERDSGASSRLDPYLSLLRYARELKSLEPGPVFVLRPDAWWAAWLASMVTTGPIVTSSDPRMRPFSTHRADANPHHHATLQVAAIANALNPSAAGATVDRKSLGLSITSRPDSQDQAEELLRLRSVTGDYVVVHPGSGADVKLWPDERWRNVVRRLNEWNLPVLITGSRSESAPTGAIARGQPCAVDLAGETPLPLLAALLRRAKLVLGTDNGPLHLAVACETPTIHLFGPSNPERYGPWGPPDRHRVITSHWTCPRCGDLSLSRPEGCGCMLAISTDTVIAVAREMLGVHAAT